MPGIGEKLRGRLPLPLPLPFLPSPTEPPSQNQAETMHNMLDLLLCFKTFINMFHAFGLIERWPERGAMVFILEYQVKGTVSEYLWLQVSPVEICNICI